MTWFTQSTLKNNKSLFNTYYSANGLPKSFKFIKEPSFNTNDLESMNVEIYPYYKTVTYDNRTLYHLFETYWTKYPQSNGAYNYTYLLYFNSYLALSDYNNSVLPQLVPKDYRTQNPTNADHFISVSGPEVSSKRYGIIYYGRYNLNLKNGYYECSLWYYNQNLNNNYITFYHAPNTNTTLNNNSTYINFNTYITQYFDELDVYLAKYLMAKDTYYSTYKNYVLSLISKPSDMTGNFNGYNSSGNVQTYYYKTTFTISWNVVNYV